MLAIIKDKTILLLRKSEKYTKTDMVYLFSGGTWLIIGQIISSACALTLAVLFANFLPKEQYGLYKFLLSIASLLSIFALPGMTTALTKAVARGFEGSIVAAVNCCMRWSMFGLGIGIVLAGYYFVQHNNMIGYGVLVVACFVPIFDTFTNFSAYFLGKADFRGNIIANIFVQVGATLTLVVSLLYVKNILFILFAYFGSYSVLYYICYQYVLKQIPENAQEDPGTLPYGKHLSLMSVLSVVASNIDKILLFHLLGPAEVAIYTITTSAPDQLKSVLGFLTTLFFPQFAKKSESDIRAVMRHTFFLFFITSAVGITIYIALAPWFFHVFFRQYEHYILLSQIFAVSLLTISFDPALIYLNSHGRIREQYWSTTIGNVMQIIAIVALAIPFGLWGVIIARVVVRFLSNLLNVFFYYYPLTTTTSL